MRDEVVLLWLLSSDESGVEDFFDAWLRRLQASETINV